MAAWTRQGIRLDIALAVVMEISVLQLGRAESQRQYDEAVVFNDRLWRVIGDLAPDAPVAEDRVALANTSAVILAGGRRPDQLIELNRCFARLLAGRAATAGSLGQILDSWRAAQRAGTTLEFGPWLLEVLDGFAAPQSHALAA